MAISVLSNVSSLIAQYNFAKTQNNVNNLVQQLSSGSRINSAGDDPAGLTILQTLTAQLNAMDQASRNTNDGISALQIGNSALGQISNVLQQINALAVQSANGTNSSSQRANLNTEVQQLVSQIDTIATQTQFNGLSLLSTQGGISINFQSGPNLGNQNSVVFADSRATSLGVSSNYTSVATATSSSFANTIRTEFTTATDSTVNGTLMTAVGVNQNSINKINAINATSSQSGLTAFSFGNAVVGTSAADDDVTSLALNAGDITVNGVSVGAVSANTADGLVTAINAISGQTGVTANAGGAGTSNIVLYNTTGAAVTVGVNTANAATRSGIAVGTTTVAAGENGAIVLNQNVGNTTVTFGNVQTGQALTGTASAGATLTSTPISQVNVSTVPNSNLAINAVGQALTTVSSSQASLGAFLNRLTSIVNNLGTGKLATTQAVGRIKDVDYAEVVGNLAKNQLLQQATISVLAQANAQPSFVLSLLQNGNK